MEGHVHLDAVGVRMPRAFETDARLGHFLGVWLESFEGPAQSR